MACIICFLEDEFQQKLRNISQSKGERFEDTLIEYKNTFFSEYNFLTSIKKCRQHQSLSFDTKLWATRLHQLISRIKDKEQFFQSIIDCYITWISGDTTNSINTLESIIKAKDIFSFKGQIDSSIYFRGRQSEILLQKEDMNHIPFNKRYYVSNQRYSLSGQPIFYFGLSVLDVLAELRVSHNSFNNVYFSSFIISNNSLNIFDFTSSFQAEIKQTEILTSYGSKIDYLDSRWGNLTIHPKAFFKYILLSICSFQRVLEKTSFIEEYVIPQLITEIARKNSFDGILFPSTRINKSIAYSDEKFHVARYKENLALFTNYQRDEKFDSNLISKFLISKPIKLCDYQEISFDEIENLSKQIIQLNNKKGVFTSLKQIAELTGINYKVLFEKLKIKDSTGNFVYYFEHPVGKMHTYILYCHLLSLRNRLV